MENQSKILADKISSKLSKSGISSDRIELERLANNGDSSAQYKMACHLLNRGDCKIPFKDNSDYLSWDQTDRIASKNVFIKSIDPYGDWFKWLLQAAKSHHNQAIEDLIFLFNFHPYIKHANQFFEIYKIAAENPEFTYIDEYGTPQPCALKIAEIYWTGRVHFPSRLTLSYMSLGWNSEQSKDHPYDRFDSSCEHRLENGVAKSLNVIGENPEKAVLFYKKAAGFKSLAAMDKLCSILLFGGSFSDSKCGIMPDIASAIQIYKQLEELGGYAMPSYKGVGAQVIVNENSFRWTNPCHIAGVYLYGAPGIEQNLEIAVDRYSKCVDMGYKEAESQLRHILDHIQAKKPLPPIPKDYPPEIGKKSIASFFSRLFK
jgi:TPR repeat protein